jgi:hypothetical protein
LAVAAEAWLESIDSCQKPRRVKTCDFSSQRLHKAMFSAFATYAARPLPPA